MGADVLRLHRDTQCGIDGNALHAMDPPRRLDDDLANVVHRPQTDWEAVSIPRAKLSTPAGQQPSTRQADSDSVWTWVIALGQIHS